MNERRRRRSDAAHEAVDLFLESVRARAGLTALALSTSDGRLVGGAGSEVDVEWMGALGASSGKSSLDWDGHTLHVQPVKVNDVEFVLTSAGSRVESEDVAAGLHRILAT